MSDNVDYLEAKRSRPLIGNISKYQHVERLGHDDVQGILDGEVVVQEKLDGANLTVAWDEEAGLVVASRNQPIYARGEKKDSFNGAVDYVLSKPGLQEAAKDGYIFRGEWLVHHTVMYQKEAFGKFYVFDVQRRDGEYEPCDAYRPALAEIGVDAVPEIARGVFTPEQLAELTQGPSSFGPEREGIVIKRYGFRNQWGRTVWAKLVSADFKERCAAKFGATKFDAIEAKFVADCLPTSLVHKIIDKIKDQKGEVSVRDMGEVIGRAWSDVFQEELWTFVKKEKVETFNFHTARKLVTDRTRNIALARFNGIPTAGRFEQ